MKKTWTILGLSTLFFSQLSFAVDLTQIENGLKSTGIVGFVHGSVESQGLFVFTYRNPNDFFDSVQMSLVAHDAAIEKTLAQLGRHDKVRIKGAFLKNPSPQKHINLTSLEVVQPYKPGYEMGRYPHTAKIPEELKGKGHAKFLVHAMAGEGHILVLEFKDSLVPVFARNVNFVKDLYRNDLIELSYLDQDFPEAPTHLKLNESIPQPIKVLESIKAIHGKPGSIEGALVLFPKSPDIIFNVFAVEQLLPAGLRRQFTLINFENPEVFKKMREKLQAAWNRHPRAYFNGRNKLISTAIKVRASGIFNEVDASQANPQVLIQKLDDLQILE